MSDWLDPKQLDQKRNELERKKAEQEQAKREKEQPYYKWKEFVNAHDKAIRQILEDVSGRVIKHGKYKIVAEEYVDYWDYDSHRCHSNYGEPIDISRETPHYSWAVVSQSPVILVQRDNKSVLYPAFFFAVKLRSNDAFTVFIHLASSMPEGVGVSLISQRTDNYSPLPFIDDVNAPLQPEGTLSDDYQPEDAQTKYTEQGVAKNISLVKGAFQTLIASGAFGEIGYKASGLFTGKERWYTKRKDGEYEFQPYTGINCIDVLEPFYRDKYRS